MCHFAMTRHSAYLRFIFEAQRGTFLGTLALAGYFGDTRLASFMKQKSLI
jgi:hypothetical protein